MTAERRPKGLSIRVDQNAESASSDLPAFLARPEGAPVYHGFPSTGIEVDGFTLGEITAFIGEDYGDGYVVAPDGSRAGLAWQIDDEPFFVEARAPEPGRWGVWGVAFTSVMQDEADVRANFADIVPKLRKKWTAWRSKFAER